MYSSLRPLPLEGQTASSPLAGIWENRTRIIRFTEVEVPSGNVSRDVASSGALTFVFKTWYGWYYDELPGYSWSYTPDEAAGDTGADTSGELTVTYPDSKEPSVIPIYIGNDELYLDFLVRNTPSSLGVRSAAEFPFSGFWRAGGNANAVMIEAPQYSKEIYGYYFTEEHMYRIRYWLTDMEYNPEDIAFIMDSGNEYEVSKFIRLAGRTYICTTGRGILVRNPEKTAYHLSGDTLVLDNENQGTLRFHLSADGSILTFAEPWISRSPITDLDTEIKSHNAMRRPSRKPPLEFMDLKFPWDK
jgi:hypothetical protein